MDRRTLEWLELLSRALVWAALIVLVLSVIGAIQVATTDNELPFFENVQRESRTFAAIGALGGGITAAGILAGLGAILSVLLSQVSPPEGRGEAPAGVSRAGKGEESPPGL